MKTTYQFRLIDEYVEVTRPRLLLCPKELWKWYPGTRNRKLVFISVSNRSIRGWDAWKMELDSIAVDQQMFDEGMGIKLTLSTSIETQRQCDAEDNFWVCVEVPT